MIQVQEINKSNGYLYDLGHAHGKTTYSNVSEFLKAIVEALDGRKLNLMAYTNTGQTIERGFLDKIGFSSAMTTDKMMFHSIPYSVFKKACKNVKEAIEAELAEAKVKKKEYYKALRENEVSLGRTPGEFRVGDVIYYKNAVQEDPYDVEREGGHYQPYVLMRAMPEGGWSIKALHNRGADEPQYFGSEYYQTRTRGYAENRMVRARKYWNTPCTEERR